MTSQGATLIWDNDDNADRARPTLAAAAVHQAVEGGDYDFMPIFSRNTIDLVSISTYRMRDYVTKA